MSAMGINMSCISIYCKDVINIRLTRYISFRLEFCGVCHKHFGIFCLNKILNIDEMIIIFFTNTIYLILKWRRYMLTKCYTLCFLTNVHRYTIHKIEVVNHTQVDQLYIFPCKYLLSCKFWVARFNV